ncbi:MFS transporter [Azospirillum melinis]|uniref:MFS transporter n=1 Tax=Azospirillum melinis TaxID=328839 RepID=A0ABX2KJ73_9PROT|nr:MFS transporter [Azospirillum melinis]MBP2309623.1 MFS family permease [Azospirillum melinis]NUB03648.1 MFS transporter [Azospirillum melinis]
MTAEAAGSDSLERATMRKVILRLVPFLMLCYFFNLLDRSNIGVASLQMRPHLGLTAAAYGLGASLFFFGYFLFEVPSNLMLQRYGARRWIARIMVSWGIMCVLMALTQGPLTFYVLRFLLGVAEAGFFPGIVLFSTYWFPARYRAQIVAAFSMSVPLASFIGSPISAGLLHADGVLGLHGWQWVFVAEGIPTVLLGFACLLVLKDRPTDARWLSAEQQAWLTRTLETERGTKRTVGHLTLAQLARNPYVWGLALACSASSAASSSLSVWQPQLIKSFGLTNFETGLVNSIPYGIAAALMMFWGMHSDRTGERRWHTALPLMVISAGVIGVFFAADSLALTVVLLSCVLASYSSFKGPFWAFTSGTLSPTTAAAGIAGINAVSNLVGGGMVSLVGAIQDSTGSYGAALLPIALLALTGALVVLAIGAQKNHTISKTPAAAE